MAERKTSIIHVDEHPWEDGGEIMTLPDGPRMKIYASDDATGRTDTLINFPPGYIEPRHTHSGWHSCFLLEGRWIVEGKEIKAGSYMHGPAGPEQPHGPFHSPEGSLVFATYSGTRDTMGHNWDATDPHAPAPAEQSAQSKTRIVDIDELDWQDGSNLMTLPAGVRMKVFDEDEAAGRTDALIEFPPGYVEPRHTHSAAHTGCLLKGDWIVEGKLLKPGSYFYGPAGDDQPHGPFESPNGTLIFISFQGGTGAAIEHHWDSDH